ncbi:similar to Saccharomyces cerevisiae YLR453C RIF2 Protein that binds to the Rap1p C-terminus and acts synergistically with Rif1p to help control telomere length and establish telomeric silencing [Maudiozyma barnettii]|uniref:Origin recognition complex subunit 4 n=1 Tax=Maudiozyma barnettii TaxID=61262 RepID=A0A8H2VGD7_9SACH|nr:uncharacterized protein KABA2_05S06028 [Kazachstania barnettii]CAB4254997.1 similar to Saccharomyces cerevisiae YLR453C RIF2 Protein that binds to the Rap1p C-terminus and acts synergistically with Rif1p to help control telomere length and establish telomeric silencing [Kazachstania barnettii]CAD1783268.1 similar to Saccharomyces cerevisiae YLR453C RIF2 Protein that binds to the Rap1p C-terminus and acts synergistically with Rif1p to help control telomere length and establish telomeric silenci
MSESNEEMNQDQKKDVFFETSPAIGSKDGIATLESNKRNLEEDSLENNKNKLSKINSHNNSHTTEITDSHFIDFKIRLLRHINQTLPYEETKIYSYLTETRQEVSRILKQSIIQKESHSAIMVGPRNSYKSSLINNELRYLSQDHSDQFIVVRLNGLIHSEQTAIKSIALQLELELKRLNQDQTTSADDSIDVSTGSLTEIFEKILKLLDATKTHENKDGSESAKVSVVFVFDEIDTFAGPVRQTLLYNLFDMVEHSVVPVCIIGTTTKLNISEFLEKRVRSRFSQRVIYVPEPNDLDDFVIASGESLSPMIPRTSDDEVVYLKKWNDKIDILLKDESSPLFLEVHRNYETFKSQTVFRNSLLPLVSGCSNFEELQDAITTCKAITNYSINQYQNDSTAIVQTLSDLELVILIAAARTILKSRDESTNFNITYVEYSNIIKSLNARIPSTNNLNSTTDKILDNLIKLWSKEDVKNVWETLQEFKFLTEKGAMGLRESSLAVFYASNYLIQTTTIPFDLRTYNMQITLHDLRGVVSKSSMFYPWTQL